MANSKRDAESVNLSLQLRRSPLDGVDVRDSEQARGWMMRRTDGAVAQAAELPDALRYLRRDAQESAPTKGVVELGKEGLLALFFRAAGDREGVLRCFREGELRVRDEAGRMRRAAALVEWVRGEPEAWWRAWRFFGEGGDGVGQFHGPWHQDQGEGVSTLPYPFREWLDPGKAELESTRYGEVQPLPKESFDLRMASFPLPLSEPLNDAAAVAELLGRLTEDEVRREGLTFRVVYLFHGKQVERWELRGAPPVPVDELVRGLVAMVEAYAAALVVPGTAHTAAGTKRSVNTLIEVGGPGQASLRARRSTLVLRDSMGPPTLRRGALEPLGLVAEGEGWIGVAPKRPLQLRPLGMMTGGPVAES